MSNEKPKPQTPPKPISEGVVKKGGVNSAPKTPPPPPPQGQGDKK